MILHLSRDSGLMGTAQRVRSRAALVGRENLPTHQQAGRAGGEACADRRAA